LWNASVVDAEDALRATETAYGSRLLVCRSISMYHSLPHIGMALSAYWGLHTRHDDIAFGTGFEHNERASGIEGLFSYSAAKEIQWSHEIRLFLTSSTYCILTTTPCYLPSAISQPFQGIPDALNIL